MKSRIFSKGAQSLAILSVMVCVVMLYGCGSGAGDKVDSKGAGASESPGNGDSAVAANSPGSTVPAAISTDKMAQQGATPTRNTDNARVSSGPKPQIGSGGNDLFQFTQARAAISADAELKTTNIVIAVKAGVLTLSGTVANASQKSKAEQLVRAVGGVKEVNNRLRILN